MSKKTKVIFIVLAGLILVIAGVFASFSLIQRMQASQAPVVAEDSTVKTNVVVATRDLSLGDRISGSDITIASVPVEIAPRTAITTIDAALDKIIKSDLIQGEMVLSNNLADPTNNSSDLSFILSDDHVLMAFPASDLISRENIIQRGDIVDIFATFKQKVKTVGETTATNGEPQEPETRTFTVDTLQRVGVTALVLEVIEEESNQPALMQNGDEPAGNAPPTRIRAYLFALNPRDALILKHLKDTDAIFDIVLRAPTSTIQFDLTPITEEFIIEYYGLEILP